MTSFAQDAAATFRTTGVAEPVVVTSRSGSATTYQDCKVETRVESKVLESGTRVSVTVLSILIPRTEDNSSEPEEHDQVTWLGRTYTIDAVGQNVAFYKVEAS